MPLCPCAFEPLSRSLINRYIMKTPKIIYQVDAFTTEPFKGNPAAVCILDSEPSITWMQNIAMEMNLYDFCLRFFAPAIGIDEDPVTGSAHCALVPFWYMKTGRNDFISHQVSKRTGILKVSLKGDRVEISGQAKTIFKADLFV